MGVVAPVPSWTCKRAIAMADTVAEHGGRTVSLFAPSAGRVRVSSGIAADEATPFRRFHNLRIVARGNELRDTS